MATKTLLSQTGAVGAGSIVFFSETDNVRTIQVNPNASSGFSGSLIIEGSYAASPGAGDFVTIAEVTFAGHVQNMTIDIRNSSPNIRANIVTSNQGEIAVYGDSRSSASLIGGSGSGPATAVITSSSDTAVTGNNVRIDAPIVPSITSDDVIYANDFAFTVTDKLDGKMDKPSDGGTLSPNLKSDDMNLLAGLAAYPVTNEDLKKMGDVYASSSDLNATAGANSNFQSQIDTLSSGYVLGAGVDLTGLNVSASQLNTFFAVPITASAGDLNKLDGMTASTADLNGLTGTAGTFLPTDLTKLGNITATATELNALAGWAGSSSDLNKIIGLTASPADINAIVGLDASGVTTNEIKYLSGLTQNVQSTLDTIPNLTGLSASVNDMNLLTGAAMGTGEYSGAISATEISRLDGISSNIQAQLNAKRNNSDTIGIDELTNNSISIIEHNYLEGARANIQWQIDNLSGGTITPAGGVFNGSVGFAAGSAVSPSIYFVPSNGSQTGLFLHGNDGLGFAANGIEMASIESNNFSIGEGTISQSPMVHGYATTIDPAVTPITNPAYAFIGSNDSGMYSRLKTLDSGLTVHAVGISSGGQTMIEFDGSAVGINPDASVEIGGDSTINAEVRISGVFAGEKMLGKAEVKAGNLSGPPVLTNITDLYTVGVGRTAVISKVLVVLTNSSAAVDSNMVLNIGFGISLDEIVDNSNNGGIFAGGSYTFGTAGQVMPLGTGDNTFPAISGNSGAAYGVLPAGSALKAHVAGLAVQDDFDFEVIVFGYEY